MIEVVVRSSGVLHLYMFGNIREDAGNVKQI